ncbi:hypothetical protein HYDPIDRAFT_140645 [Hydnomerulius pinastri MD-312]|uniref:Anaphase-promoting complex subunit 4 WD40 domain-containing protein n=1 Tax=Hydnomerulius pinastri MD-312 TaxID=994086 RepID=A0A0C9VP11_9AGAM|nr:hypothetical protein HYDPIDRAFT_140645 [Hydnomerulius pinastri MD-312]
MSSTSAKPIDRARKPLLTISAHAQLISGLVFLPGGEHIVTRPWDKTIRIWDAMTGEEVGAPMNHGADVRCVAVTRDGKRIMSGGEDGKLKAWEVETHQLLEVWEGHTIMTGTLVDSLCFSPNGERIASGLTDSTIQVFDAATGNFVLGPIKGHEHAVRSVLWSSDGSHIFSGS